MKLIIGGAFQGKKEYAVKTFGIREEELTDGAVCGLEEIFEAACICRFQEYIRRYLKNGGDAGRLAEEILEKNRDLIIICNEMGCGVVPVDAFDRAYREAVGRICCRLALEAGEVHRVICGLGMVIRHD